MKLQVKVWRAFSVSVTLVGGLEYCCTMVYLPFLLQYNLLKTFCQQNRILKLQTSSVRTGLAPPCCVCVCFVLIA